MSIRLKRIKNPKTTRIVTPAIRNMAKAMFSGWYNEREVGKELGISTCTVSEIIRGLHDHITDEYEICPKCSAKVLMPCVFCRQKAFVSKYGPNTSPGFGNYDNFT